MTETERETLNESKLRQKLRGHGGKKTSAEVQLIAPLLER